MGGNIPGGNVDIFPVEGSISGKIVIDHSVKIEADTVVLKKPIEFVLENGEIVQINGENEIVHRLYDDLNNFSFINHRNGFDPRAIFRISGIGFGLLPLQPIGLNLMDERLLGIVSISNGNSWGKGGRNKCRGHRDHLIWLDHVKIDGEKYTVNRLGKL
jgi:leucyl aminopeptidase (aminopeptidase T)